MTALATILRRIGRINEGNPPAGAFSLAQQVPPQIPPARVQDALGQMTAEPRRKPRRFNGSGKAGLFVGCSRFFLLIMRSMAL